MNISIGAGGFHRLTGLGVLGLSKSTRSTGSTGMGFPSGGLVVNLVVVDFVVLFSNTFRSSSRILDGIGMFASFAFSKNS